MPLWGRKKNGAESGRQHGAEARSIPGWLATDWFSGVAGLLNRWAALVLWEALDEKVTPLLVEDAVESVKLRGAKLELKAAGCREKRSEVLETMQRMKQKLPKARD
ncbi:hypothetical protein NDU88_007474 [Pleurodeles waltl]|uniref:Uncharacterized protein n=1 Tax=Pleurodeles waltl TaxID=8319 RepID=A0AAV7RPK1_PLEWA|nr:hypothetical protein NDU88_007474 [Pleurodeles waltl]